MVRDWILCKVRIFIPLLFIMSMRFLPEKLLRKRKQVHRLGRMEQNFVCRWHDLVCRKSSESPKTTRRVDRTSEIRRLEIKSLGDNLVPYLSHLKIFTKKMPRCVTETQISMWNINTWHIFLVFRAIKDRDSLQTVSHMLSI